MAIPHQKPAAANLPLSPRSIIRMAWKQKTAIVLVWGAVSIGVCIAVLQIPYVYSADALILVDSQKIPDRYVSSTVVSDSQDRLAMITQQILSSGRLEKIIDDFHLYAKERQTHYQEEILALMRRDIRIIPERAWNGRSASFRIGYEGPDPAMVAQVANKIAHLYVEENLKTRESMAEGTSDFIETQLTEAKQKLDQFEGALSQYKLHHNGELPQQENSLNGSLARLGVALEANRDALNRAQQQKTMLQDSLHAAEAAQADRVRQSRQTVAAGPVDASAAPAAVLPSGPPTRSQLLQSQLNDIRLRYSDQHPEVRRLQTLFEQARLDEKKALEAAPDKVAAPAAKASGAAPPPLTVGPTAETPELAQTRDRIAAVKSQLEILNQDIATRDQEQRRILSEISAYQSRINSLPIREQEMAALTRDYEITKTNYRSLLDKKISAEMATDMERREKSERFTIIDPARIPQRPARPNRKVLAIGGSVLGLALGLALGFGREIRKGTLLGEWELPAGMVVLGRLPNIRLMPPAPGPDDGGKRHKRLRLAGSAAAFLALAHSLLGAVGRRWV